MKTFVYPHCVIKNDVVYVSSGWYELKDRKMKKVILNKYKLEIV